MFASGLLPGRSRRFVRRANDARVKAIIIGAGRGSRLKHLTEDIPKTLVPILGRPMLDGILDALAAGGFTSKDIVFICGYKADVIKSRYPQFTYIENTNWERNNILASPTSPRTADFLVRNPRYGGFSTGFLRSGGRQRPVGGLGVGAEGQQGQVAEGRQRQRRPHQRVQHLPGRHHPRYGHHHLRRQLLLDQQRPRPDQRHHRHQGRHASGRPGCKQTRSCPSAAS